MSSHTEGVLTQSGLAKQTFGPLFLCLLLLCSLCPCASGAPSLQRIIAVTATYPRPFQAAYITRQASTLHQLAPPLTWIIIESPQKVRASKVASKHFVESHSSGKERCEVSILFSCEHFVESHPSGRCQSSSVRQMSIVLSAHAWGMWPSSALPFSLCPPAFYLLPVPPQLHFARFAAR